MIDKCARHGNPSPCVACSDGKMKLGKMLGKRAGDCDYALLYRELLGESVWATRQPQVERLVAAAEEWHRIRKMIRGGALEAKEEMEWFRIWKGLFGEILSLEKEMGIGVPSSDNSVDGADLKTFMGEE